MRDTLDNGDSKVNMESKENINESAVEYGIAN